MTQKGHFTGLGFRVATADAPINILHLLGTPNEVHDVISRVNQFSINPHEMEFLKLELLDV